MAKEIKVIILKMSGVTHFSVDYPILGEVGTYVEESKLDKWNKILEDYEALRKELSRLWTIQHSNRVNSK